MTDAMEGLIERLEAIAEHDWRLSFLAHTSDTAKEAATALRSLASPVPGDDAVERPDGAIHNGRVLMDRLESSYDFVVYEGDLALSQCSDWQELRRCFEALAEYAALTAAGPGRVVEGWRLVPEEPTEKMMRAGEGAIKGGFHTQQSYRDDAVRSYHAMLSTAPPSPVPAEGKKP